jgi:hypothetical protein
VQALDRRALVAEFAAKGERLAGEGGGSFAVSFEECD